MRRDRVTYPCEGTSAPPMSSVASRVALPLLLASADAFTLSPANVLQPHRAARSAAPAVGLRMMADAEIPTKWDVPDDFLKGRTPLLKNVAEYEEMYAKSISDPDAFWSEIANTFHWETPFDKVVDANFAASKGKVSSNWFSGGKTNICYNALDRHVKAGHGDQIALYHEANDEGEDLKAWTYAEVLAEVERLANVLKSKGVKKGDRVSIFMPMVPQLPMAMLACARIGAVHSVVFGGFSAEALAGRLIDAKSTVVITANGVMRGTKPSAPRAPPRDTPRRTPFPECVSFFALPALRICLKPCVPFRSCPLRHRPEGQRDLREQRHAADVDRRAAAPVQRADAC